MPPLLVPITAAGGVEALVGRAREAGRLALDLEFLWERTYRPVPCLAQVAVEGEVALIDPLEGADLAPLAALVADREVVKLMHAPSADLTLIALGFDLTPAAIVDVQLVAGFVGLGAGQNLGTLVERVLDVRLAKAEGYSDWTRRPLSDDQLAYAADDVRYLPALADELLRRAESLGRTRWVEEELERRYGPDARFTTDPDEAWRRIKGQGRLAPRERAVLKAVAAWREREARRRDRPASWVMPDRALIELARRRPTSPQAVMAMRGLSDRLRGQEAESIVRAVGAGLAATPLDPAPSRPAELQGRIDVLVALAQVMVGARATAADLAPTLVATRDELEAFVGAAIEGASDGAPLAHGWRRDLVGEAVTRLVAGELALAPTGRPPYVEEVAVEGLVATPPSG